MAGATEVPSAAGRLCQGLRAGAGAHSHLSPSHISPWDFKLCLASLEDEYKQVALPGVARSSGRPCHGP